MAAVAFPAEVVGCEHVGMVYVTEWQPRDGVDAPALTKVGFSSRIAQRLYQLEMTFRGHRLASAWFSAAHAFPRITEQRLLEWCEDEHPTAELCWLGRETFVNLPPADAIAYARSLPVSPCSCDQSIALRLAQPA